MAFNKLAYSRDWTINDPEKGFVTHETDEATVRADMQYLYNEILNWANEMVTKLTDCSNIGMGEASTLAATNVKDALIELKGTIVAGTVPDYSLTSAQMSRKSVEQVPAVVRDNIANDAISSNELADNAVDSEHIVAGAIEHSHLASYSEEAAANAPVGTDNIRPGAITNSKIYDYSISHSKLATVSNPDGAAIDTTNMAYKSVTRDRLAGHFNATAAVTSVAGKAILVPDTFLAKVNNVVGTYTFTYNGTAWTLSGNNVVLAQYGISISGTFVSADVITVTVAATAPAVSSDQIADGGIINSNIADATIEAAKLAGSIPLSKLASGYCVPVANGGTGGTTPATARTGIEVTEQGKLKIGDTEYTLRIGTEGADGYITFVV